MKCTPLDAVLETHIAWYVYYSMYIACFRYCTFVFVSFLTFFANPMLGNGLLRSHVSLHTPHHRWNSWHECASLDIDMWWSHYEGPPLWPLILPSLYTPKKTWTVGDSMRLLSIALKVEYSSPSPRKTLEPYTPTAHKDLLPCELVGAINLCFWVRGAGGRVFFSG
jgi:hypothetical protein